MTCPRFAVTRQQTQSPLEFPPSTPPGSGRGRIRGIGFGAGTRRWWLVAGGLSLICVLGGLLNYVVEVDHLREAVYRELDSDGGLKARQVSEWREERLSDARFLTATRAVAADVATLLNRPDSSDARLAVSGWLETIKGGDRYSSVLLLDRESQVRLAIPASAPTPGAPLRARAAETLLRGQPSLSDLHVATVDGELHLDLLAPIFAPDRVPGRNADSATSGGEAVALVVFRLDPRQKLFPLLAKTPTFRKTARTRLLVQREGEELVSLDESGRRTAVLAMNAATPARPGVGGTWGRVGVHETVDEQGRRVFAAIHPVPGLPWLIVSRVEREEAYSPLRYKAWQTGGLVALLVTSVMLATGVALRARENQLLNRALEAERRQGALAERLALLTRHANDIIVLMDDTHRIVEANDLAVACYGYSLAELRERTAAELRAPEARAQLTADVALVHREGEAVFETVHQRRDGTRFPVEISSRRVLIEGRPHLLAVIRDISERKQAEAIVRRAEERLRYALEQSRTGGWELDLVDHRAYRTLEHDRIFGYQELLPEWTYEMFLEQVLPEDRERVDRSFRDAVARQVDWSFECRIRRRDGEVRWIWATGGHLRSGDGQSRCLAGIVQDITDRRMAELALRESEERHRNLFENNHAVMLLIDPRQQTIVDANPAACSFYGWSRDQLRGMEVGRINLLPREELLAEIERAQSTGSYHFEFPHRLANGAVRQVEVFSGPIQSGGRQLLLSIIHDITERRAIERALREGERLLQLFVEYAPVSLAMFDREMRYIHASRRWNLDYGLGDRVLRGLSHYEVFPEISDAWKAIHRRALAGEIIRADEDLFRRADGIEQWLRWEVRPWQDSSGSVRGIMIFSEDITARKQTELDLRASEERYRNLVETSFDWVWEVDAEARYTYSSPRVHELLGWTPEEVLGRTRFDFMPEAEAARVRRLYESIAEARRPFVALENTNLHREGRVVVLESSAVPVFRPDGTWMGYRGTDRDITARRAAEKHLRMRGAALEAAANAIMITDRGGRIEWANPAFAELSGWPVAEVLGRKPGEFLKSGRHDADFYRRIWQMIVAGQVWRGEIINRRKDGVLRTEEMTITPLADEGARSPISSRSSRTSPRRSRWRPSCCSRSASRRSARSPVGLPTT